MPVVQGPEPRGERQEVYHGTTWRGMRGILLNGNKEPIVIWNPKARGLRNPRCQLRTQ